MSGQYWKSVFYAVCIGLGLFFAYEQGADQYGLIVGALVGVGLVIALLLLQMMRLRMGSKDKKG